ncbi:flagellar protein FlaG [Terribacillus halophilus]|uniref:Flagellar protein FlaG n=1 Tax=Terribacillus halophilus TaxID=361279 RepID=A0A1G6IZU6_9BACI|nr:flagellar protein FlaG [Terribacillus halophilus]SDC12024.1 flagellar protein FlaG [Terribacillus halophilus]
MIDKLSSSASQHVTHQSGDSRPAGSETIHKQETTSNGSNPYVDYDKSDIERVIETMNQFLEPTHTNMKFELHEELERYYVTVVDSDTNQVVREIPPKKLLDAYAKMAEFMGLLVDEKI